MSNTIVLHNTGKRLTALLQVLLRGASLGRRVAATLVVVSAPALAFITAPVLAQPTDLIDLSSAARFMQLNDHSYRAAISENAAAQSERDKGRAGLLPALQAGYSYYRVSGARSQPDFRGRRVESDLRYNSSNAFVQLRQPLLDYGRYASYERGHALADQGMAKFSVSQKQAGLRVSAAYLNVLLAYNRVRLQESLADSLADMKKTFESRYRRSEATLTDVQEIDARLSLARADVIATKDQLAVAARELQSLTGTAPAHLAALKPDFPLPSLEPARLDDWLERARVNNPDVRAARQAVNVADTEVDQAGSRYLPTLNLVATYGRSQSDSLSSVDQRNNTFTVGLQLDIPIFTGGYTTANVARARADRARLQHELTAAIERTQAEVTRLYTDVRSGADRIKALQSAVESGTQSLKSARKGFEAGVMSNLDVLNTQDKLYQSRFELVRAQLTYLQARLGLVAAAGDLELNAFDEINTQYLGPAVDITRAGQ
ncbi:MAG: TolC family outer membrane protein [Alcaligenaceae bacterium]|nr:TolC family outer membrane protein [Alcaligenaceae bacterium]